MAATAESKAFIGQWKSDDAAHKDLTIHLEAGGRAVGAEGSQHYEGHWRVEGDSVSIALDNDRITGEIAADGRLILWEEGHDERIPFHKVQ